MKSFLKINMVKVIGTILLAVVNISLALYSALALLCTTNCRAPSFWQSFFSFTLYPFTVVRFTTELSEEVQPFLPEAFVIIFSLLSSVLVLTLFWYVVVCVIYKLFVFIRSSKKVLS